MGEQVKVIVEACWKKVADLWILRTFQMGAGATLHLSVGFREKNVFQAFYEKAVKHFYVHYWGSSDTVSHPLP